MSLKEYRKKRDFSKTPEPEGKRKLIFVVQKHAASHLHYDFRLEVDGVLKSWAVPKGPSMNPADKRLAIHVEDHPLDYASFEGIIPAGNYGAGTVMVWDEGLYSAYNSHSDSETEKLMREGLRKGTLHFILLGHKLKGEFSLVRMGNEDKQWLLIKMDDQYASKKDITKQDLSVLTKRTLPEISK